jgi:transcriptional repressor NrdR
MLWITRPWLAIVPLYVVVVPVDGQVGEVAVRCPFCGSVDDDRVVDSRESHDGTTIRRRRACAACGRRFTTFERVEEAPLLVLKRDGSREQFDLAKLVSGLEKATKNRPIEPERIVRIASDIEETIRGRGQREVESQEIGIEVLNALRDLDAVAYMRFASVYKDFQNSDDFERELDTLESLRKSTPPKPRTRSRASRS